jgi:adenylate cyclase
MTARYSRSYLALAVITTGLVLLGPLLAPHAVGMVRNFVFDRFQQAAPRTWDPDLPVRVVDIDEESIERIGQWPWPRAKLGQLVDRLRDKGAAVVAFDIVLSEPDRTNLPNLLAQIEPLELRDELALKLENVPTSDAVFAEALGKQPAVLGAIATHAREGAGSPQKFGLAWAGGGGEASLARFAGALPPLPIFADKAAGVGALNWLPDTDQIVRSVPLLLRAGDTTLPSLALEALRVAQGASTYLIRTAQASGETSIAQGAGITGVRVGEMLIPTGPRGEVRVHFSPHQRERFIPAWKLLSGEAGDGNRLEGAIVFVGASAEGLLDQRATPLDRLVPGVEVHAQLTESLLTGALLTRFDWISGIEITAAVLLCMLVFALVKLFPPLAAAAISMLVIASLIGTSWFLFRSQSLLVDAAYPSGSVLMALGVGVVHSLWTETAQKREIRNAFERFVSPAVVARLSRDPSRLVLGGEIREITILFSDMRSFTSLSETMDAQELTQFMNDYLTPMSDLVLAHGGTIDKYIGDAIMAFWNAPLDDPDHARNAVKSAQAMQVALEGLNETWQAAAHASGKTFPIVSTGIGLHLGPCCVGNLGSSRRFDYSAIGDPVNAASRLEGLTKGLGLNLLVSDSVRSKAPEMAWLDVGSFKLKGKNAELRVWTILGDEEVRASEAFRQFEARQNAFLAAYAAGDLSAAEAVALKLETFAGLDFRKLHAFYRSQIRAGYERVGDRPCFVMLDK